MKNQSLFIPTLTFRLSPLSPERSSASSLRPSFLYLFSPILNPGSHRRPQSLVLPPPTA